MRKRSVFIIILLCLFIGVLIGRPTTSSVEERIRIFEEDIASPSSDYKEKNIVDTNLPGKIGKKGEEVIDKVFDFSFQILERLVGK